MSIKEENICRLCLKAAEIDFQRINEIIRKMFEVLLLKMNLVVSKKPIICKDCTDILIKCFNFKSACMDIEELIVTFANDKNSTTFELKDVFEDGRNLDADISICRLCSNRSSERDFVSLRTLKKDVSFAENLQALMPEMDFDVAKNPVICTSCRLNLECYMEFVRKCLDVEEKITKFCQTKYTRSAVQIKLSEIYISKLDYNQTYVIKQEEDVIENIGKAPSEVYYCELIKPQGPLDIDDEEAVNLPLPKLNNTPCGLKRSIQKAWTQNISLTPITVDNGMSTRDEIHQCGIKNELHYNVISSETAMGKSHETKHKGVVKKKNTTNGTDALTFNCTSCEYHTKQKVHLKRHMLVHKHISEVETYKCSTCTYETKHKRNLSRHIMLIHKDVTRVNMHKCPTCTYETKYKRSLKYHECNHKNSIEAEVYKCPTCTYETKYKGNLKGHMLVHKNVTEVKIYKCSICTYEAKRKFHLKRHMLTHKSFTEVEIYKCSICTFQTKHKGSLKGHILTHKNVTEVKIYKH